MSTAAPVLWLPMTDEAADTVVAATYGSNGTLVGGDNTEDLSVAGPDGTDPGALHLDGSADYIDLGAPAAILDDTVGAIAIRFRLDALFPSNGRQFLVGVGGGSVAYPGLLGLSVERRAETSGNTRLAFYSDIEGVSHTNQDVAVGSTNLAAATWYDAILSTDGTTWTLWLNGIAETLTFAVGENNGDWFVDLSLTNPRLSIGASKYNGGDISHFGGQLADCQIYSYALTPGQATRLAANPYQDIPTTYAENTGILRPVLRIA